MESPRASLSVEVRLPRLTGVVVINGLDLGVELDRRLPLLPLPDPGVLDPAEGEVRLAADGGRVHVDDPALDLVDEAEDRRGIARVDARGELVTHAVRGVERLLETVDARDREDGAEDLLLRE